MLHDRRRLMVFGTLGLAVALAVGTSGVAAPASSAAAAIGTEAADASPRATLTAFRSEAELQRWLKRRKEAMERERRRMHRMADGVASTTAPPPAPPPPPAAAAQATEAAADTSITNVQEQGVDEGDIVKVRGDILVILRRGRIFTVSLAGGGMRPIDSIDAYPPGVNARSDWYDEMLISGNRVIIIGYSYGRGGTEVNRFHLSRDGRLRWEDAYHLRSNDYYSSRNYASRLIGTKLIMYTPIYLNFYSDDPMVSFPAYRRWTGDIKAQFQRMVTASHVYYSPRLDDDQVAALHTVSSCDLAAPVLDCKATSVLGPAGRTFYVSPRAVYVWVTAWARYGSNRNRPAPSMLYRLPLDGSAPSAVGVAGAPVDQFSFREDSGREDGAGGVINVLVRASGRGDAMWMPERPEGTRGGIALLRLPIRVFGDGTRDAANSRYRVLPMPKGEGYDFHNRFVGNYVLYGTGTGWGRPTDQRNDLMVVPVRGGPVTTLAMPHGVDRIEVMGQDAVVVGSTRGDVIFSEIELQGAPREGDRYRLQGAAQAETRSHGFFYKPEGRGGDEGVLGLPVARPATPGYRHLFQTSAAVVFIRRTEGRFHDLGDLAARSEGAVNDNCVASCVDWYGNARPIFYGNRTFALMGYELVEGRLQPRRIREVGRVNFAPGQRLPPERRTGNNQPAQPDEPDQQESWLGDDE
jgi:hypothetical protein